MSASDGPLPTNGPHLSGETVTFPLVLVKGFPFVEGTINGQKGKLLFDIGDVKAFSLDSHTVSPPGGVVAGEGMFGSGQTFQRMRFPKIDTLSLPNGMRFTAMTNIPGSPGIPLEQDITSDFIGWLGHGFFSGYVVRLDYAVPSVTFYRDDATGKGVRAATRGETAVKIIALGNPAHHDIPTFPAKVGAVDVLGTIDTGAHNTAVMSDEVIAALEHAGNLKDDGKGNFTISGITVDGLALPPMAVDLHHGKPHVARFLPQPDAPFLCLGYEFWKLYKVVLDYDREKMMLLKR